MKKQETWLPIFTGFYHSIFCEDENYIESETSLSENEFKEYYSELVENGITQEYFNENMCDYLDYSNFHNEASEAITHALLDIDYTGILQDIEYQSLQSPKYYNFSTDSINCEITYDHDLMMKYLEENKSEFKKYIEDRYTSRDGFSSSYPDDVDYWLDPENHDEHGLGSILNFIFINELSDDAHYDLYNASNLSEVAYNSLNFDSEKMIKDFKNK